MGVESRSIPLQRREAAFAPASFNADTRTVELTWSTGARVMRYDLWTGKRYEEELSLEAGAVRLDRLNAGAPLLNSHSAYDLTDIIGVVEQARIENGHGVARVRFSEREGVAPLVADIQAGIIRNVSVGYQVGKYQIEERDNAPSLYRAVDWTPMELSMVAIGADAGAQVRSGAPEYPCEFVTRGGEPHEVSIMTDATTAAPAAALTTPVPPPSQTTAPAPDVAAAVAAERARIAEIETLCTRHGLQTLRGEFIGSGATVDAVRAKILDTLATRDSVGTETRRGSHLSVVRDEVDTRREAMINALQNRVDPRHALTEQGREYRNQRLASMAAICIQAAGGRTAGLTERQMAIVALNLDQGLATRAGMHSTSDFPIICGATVARTLRQAYELAVPTFTAFSRRGTLPDFREVSRVQLSELTALKEVKEGAEYQYLTLGETAEKYKLLKYGGIVALTWEAVVNDDLGAFSRIPLSAAHQARALEADIVYGILSTNAALADGVALFHATHGNLAGTGTAISEASLAAGRAAIRKQTGSQGLVLNLFPEYLIVGPDKELEANKFTSAQFVAAKATDINPNFNTSLQVIVDARITGNTWYLVASPSRIDTIEYAFLEGEEGLFTEERMGFEVDGLEIKIRHVFGAKAIDFRGMFKNSGA